MERARTRDWEQACVVKKTEASPQGANEGLCLGGGCRSRNIAAQRYRVTAENNGIKDWGIKAESTSRISPFCGRARNGQPAMKP